MERGCPSTSREARVTVKRPILLVTGLASLLYVADVVFGHPTDLTLAVGLQIAVFVLVALATGWLTSRVRVVGQEREVLEQQVKRLQLEAGDILRNIGSGVVFVVLALIAFLIATHNPDLARRADRGYRLVEGRATAVDVHPAGEAP